MTYQSRSNDGWHGLDSSSFWKGNPLSARVSKDGLVDWLVKGRQPRYTRFRNAQTKSLDENMVLFYIATQERLLSDRPVIFVKDSLFGETCALMRSVAPDLFPTTAFLEIVPLSQASFYFSENQISYSDRDPFDVMCTAALYWAGIGENFHQGPSIRTALEQISNSVIFSVLSGVFSGYSDVQLRFLIDAWKDVHERNFKGVGLGVPSSELEAFLLIQSVFSGANISTVTKESNLISQFFRAHLMDDYCADSEDLLKIDEMVSELEFAGFTSGNSDSFSEFRNKPIIMKAFIIAYSCHRNSSSRSTWLSQLGEYALCPITRIFYGVINRFCCKERAGHKSHSIFKRFVELCKLSVSAGDVDRADLAAAELDTLPPSLKNYAQSLSFSEEFITLRLLGPAIARMKDVS